MRLSVLLRSIMMPLPAFAMVRFPTTQLSLTPREKMIPCAKPEPCVTLSATISRRE